MKPFQSLFSNKSNADKSSVLKSSKENVKEKSVELQPEIKRASRKPSGNFGVIGQQKFSNFLAPEEEVFTISLETPPGEEDKKQRDRDRSGEWPLLETDDERNSTFDRSFRSLDLSATWEAGIKKTHPSATPEDFKTGSKVGDMVAVRAPQRQRHHGRAEQLTRYIHKYECEDIMEYAVDVYHWKRSLEDQYQVGDWQYTQHEVTPFMRFTLLEWLVTVARTLDFSLETWCLAVNYLDRFLCRQQIGKDCLQLVGLTAIWIAAKQEELLPPSLDQLVALCAESYSAINFQHMELLMLSKLEFKLAAPTAAYLLSHLTSVEEEKDWSEDLSRHMVEIILEDHFLARERPSKIAHAIYDAIKSFDASAVQILESSCPRCEPENGDLWAEQLFHQCLHRVLEFLAS